MDVTCGPCSLRTVIALPWKLITSKYVPGATRTISPCVAALIAPWIVGTSSGTRIVAASMIVVVIAHKRITKATRELFNRFQTNRFMEFDPFLEAFLYLLNSCSIIARDINGDPTR